MIEQIHVSKTLAAKAEQVWAAISCIGGLDLWFPAIAACSVTGSGVGAIRLLTLADGGAVMKDRIEEINHASKRLRYDRIESPFPVQSYRGTVDIRAVDEKTAELSWQVEIDVQEEQRNALAELLRNALAAGIDGLERYLQTNKPA